MIHVTNDTTIPNSELSPLVNLTVGRFTQDCDVWVRYHTDAYEVYGQFESRTGRPLITVWLGEGVIESDGTYLWKNLHIGVPVPLNGWKEAFVMVAAHEAYHLRNWQLGCSKGDAAEEIECDKHAVGVLEEYRKRGGEAKMKGCLGVLFWLAVAAVVSAALTSGFGSTGATLIVIAGIWFVWKVVKR